MPLCLRIYSLSTSYSKGLHTHASAAVLSNLVGIMAPAQFGDLIVRSGAGVNPNVP